MQFLAIVRYSHGGQVTHEFRCPLERGMFLRTLWQTHPEAEVQLTQEADIDDSPPDDEADWYDPKPTTTEGGTIE